MQVMLSRATRVALGTLVPALLACAAGERRTEMEIAGVGRVTLLNMDRDAMARDCLDEKLRELTALVRSGQLEPARVKIDRDHTIVKDVLRERTLELHLERGDTVLYVPVKHHGTRLVEKAGDDYRLLGVPADRRIDFEACLR